MTNILLQPVEVVRDENGYWTHPDLSKVSTWGQSERISGTQFEQFLQQQNAEIETVFFNGDAPTEILKQYEDGDANVSGWNPTKPDGDGWFMLSLHDTEDSPICWWIRSLDHAQKTEPSLLGKCVVIGSNITMCKYLTEVTQGEVGDIKAECRVRMDDQERRIAVIAGRFKNNRVELNFCPFCGGNIWTKFSLKEQAND